MLFAPPDNMLPMKDIAGGVLLNIRVSPGASKTKIGKIEQREGILFLKVYIKEPAVLGSANKALVNFLSDCLQVKKSFIEIKKGLGHKSKVLFIQNVDISAIAKKII